MTRRCLSCLPPRIVRLSIIIRSTHTRSKQKVDFLLPSSSSSSSSFSRGVFQTAGGGRRGIRAREKRRWQPRGSRRSRENFRPWQQSHLLLASLQFSSMQLKGDQTRLLRSTIYRKVKDPIYFLLLFFSSLITTTPRARRQESISSLLAAARRFYDFGMMLNPAEGERANERTNAPSPPITAPTFPPASLPSCSTVVRPSVRPQIRVWTRVKDATTHV